MIIGSTLIWFVVALICIIAEMLLGTLYLLALALGCIVAGILSYFDCSLSTQWMAAGIITIIGAIIFYFLKRKNKQQDQDDNLDIGHTVVVESIALDGSSEVHYRGTNWKARAQSGELTTGIWQIAAIEGIELILSNKIKDL